MNLLAQAEGRSFFDNEILDDWEVPFGAWIDQTVDWIDNNLQWLLDALSSPFEVLIDLLVNKGLAQWPWVAVILGIAILASLARNIKVGGFVAVALTICGLLGNDYWVQTARTIGFIFVAVLLSVIVGIPIGVACGRVDGFWKVVRPILDAMQVVHSFVYMLPFIFFFGIGEVSATMVTMVFALPPLIRLTNLGIRQVPEDVVEASRAYGAPEIRVLVDVQLPLARRAIMTGINQTLLLAISMLGVAAIMGAGGLGAILFRALSNQDVALAASGGLAFFLVAVVLDRMTQREDSDTGNLFRRIHLAWAHRTNPEVLLTENNKPKPAKKVDAYAAVTPAERTVMLVTGAGAMGAIVSVFLPWTAEAGKISAYGRRVDEALPGEVFSGLHASGGSFFGIIILLMALFALASVANVAWSPGKGPRWLSADGAIIASIAMTLTALAHLLATPSFLGVDPGAGTGVLVAVAASLVATIGSTLWVRRAPHSPLHPLKAGIAWGRLISVAIIVAILTVGMLGGWSFDGRQDVVITPELQAQMDALRQKVIDNPQDAGPISAEFSTLMASAQSSSDIVTDGLSDEGSGLGLWALLAGLIGAAASAVAAGVFGIDERRQWQWSAVTSGIGAGIACIALAWVLTHVRSADPNYLSGIGSFLTMLGGALLVASGSGVLKEFRRSRVYEDFALPEVTAESELVTA